MNFHKAVVVACGLALFGLPVYAHHAFAAEFNASKPVMLTGRVTRFEWQNPHARLYLIVHLWTNRKRQIPSHVWSERVPSYL